MPPDLQFFRKSSPNSKRCCTVLIMLIFVLFCCCNSIIAELTERDCVSELATDNDVNSRICVGRAQVVEVGQNSTLNIIWDSSLATSLRLSVHVEHQDIVKFPPQININSSETLVLTGVKAGKSIISFECEDNLTIGYSNSSCPLSDEVFIFLKREVSFVNSLLLDVITLAVGWTYTILWVLSYYPQKYYSCKRGTVVGFNFTFVGLSFTTAVAYLLFNVSLFWIPHVQDEYFRRHSEGVNPVQLNDVAFSLCALISLIIWICQCLILKREGQKISFVGTLFIALLWLLILSCTVMGAVGFMKWLDALYIISYTTVIAATVKYIPMVWSNFQRKSTEGFSPYTTILNLVGGLFSILQMLMLAYNYDDWKSIFGDSTKFGLGLVTVVFEITIFLQHYLIYRKAWMKKYKLSTHCTCNSECWKCKESTANRRRSSEKVCDSIVLPEKKVELKSVVYI